MSTRPKPLPCPFCGARGRDVSAQEVWHGPKMYAVTCDNCGCEGPHIVIGADSDGCYTKAEAIRAWNTRTK